MQYYLFLKVDNLESYFVVKFKLSGFCFNIGLWALAECTLSYMLVMNPLPFFHPPQSICAFELRQQIVVLFALEERCMSVGGRSLICFYIIYFLKDR